jgi:hypothetical protein
MGNPNNPSSWNAAELVILLGGLDLVATELVGTLERFYAC